TACIGSNWVVCNGERGAPKRLRGRMGGDLLPSPAASRHPLPEGEGPRLAVIDHPYSNLGVARPRSPCPNSDAPVLKRIQTIPATTHIHAAVKSALVLAKPRTSKARLVPTNTIIAEIASPLRQKKLSMAVFPLYFSSRLVRRNNACLAVVC